MTCACTDTNLCPRAEQIAMRRNAAFDSWANMTEHQLHEREARRNYEQLSKQLNKHLVKVS